jgi:hypothetical protein
VPIQKGSLPHPSILVLLDSKVNTFRATEMITSKAFKHLMQQLFLS